MLLLGLSLLGNAFQLLWTSAADAVVYVAREDVEALLRESRTRLTSSSDWLHPWVELPKLVIIEEGNLINFRGLLFGSRAQRTMYVWRGN